MSYEKLEKLIVTANKLKEGVKLFNEYSNTPGCDKRGLEFNTRGDHEACELIKLYLSSWKGFYGDSSCTRIISLSDNGTFTKYFMNYLNDNIQEILIKVSDLIMNDVKKLKDDSLKELQQKIIEIQNL